MNEKLAKKLRRTARKMVQAAPLLEQHMKQTNAFFNTLSFTNRLRLAVRLLRRKL